MVCASQLARLTRYPWTCSQSCSQDLRAGAPVDRDARDQRIAQRRLDGATLDELVVDFGLSRGMVSRICRGRLTEAQLRDADARSRRPRTAPTIALTCDCCSGEFELLKSEVRAWPHRRFCDALCQAAVHWAGPDATKRRARAQTTRNAAMDKLRDEGLEPLKSAAGFLGYSDAALRLGNKVPVERRIIGGLVRVGVNAREVLPRAVVPNARGKLAKPLAALNDSPMGGPRALSENEARLVVALRDADPMLWSWRKLRDRINSERMPSRKAVSHMAVKRAYQRSAGL